MIRGAPPRRILGVFSSQKNLWYALLCRTVSVSSIGTQVYVGPNAIACSFGESFFVTLKACLFSISVALLFLFVLLFLLFAVFFLAFCETRRPQTCAAKNVAGGGYNFAVPSSSFHVAWKGHSAAVSSLSWIHSPPSLLSSSADGLAKIWTADGHALLGQARLKLFPARVGIFF